ncbi:DUF2218 domain-containing protein [Azospirillum halopraeferens]|uniref:DUF2218 domain-containing protein n=1 Tax=Azospirillum halopraeferens TaxID=34010 RepID=UPI0003F4F254|nr:DUF2218 domain-containing protein [Azospirillum halopraeferens]
MIAHRTQVATDAAGRYLVQLCKHFAHKITVEYDDCRGRADFPWGTCHMEAADGVLTLRCESDSAEGVERVKAVVDDHLTRFAWREKPVLIWEEA